MYADPKRVRDHRVSINLDAYEAALIQALVDYTGSDRASLVRKMLIAQAEASLLPVTESMAVTGARNESRIRSI